MDNVLITYGVLVVLGLILGFITARSSKKRETLHGGAASELFHFIASGFIAMLAPTILTNIFVLHTGGLQALLIAVIMFGIGLVASLVHAVFEKPAIAAALANAEDSGWTEEDARTSGL